MARTLTDGIRQCMAPLEERDDGGFATSFRFPGDFAGFDGHFPGNAVLPGVCLLQAFVVAAGDRRDQRGAVRRVRSVRFQAPVLPDETLQVVWTERDVEDGVVVSGTASVAGNKAAIVDLVVGLS